MGEFRSHRNRERRERDQEESERESRERSRRGWEKVQFLFPKSPEWIKWEEMLL